MKMHQKVQALVWWFKVTAINPQLWSIFWSMIIFDPRSRIIEILESWSIPFKKQNIIPTSIWKTSNAILSNLWWRQSRAAREQWSKTHTKWNNIWYWNYKNPIPKKRRWYWTAA